MHNVSGWEQFYNAYENTVYSNQIGILHYQFFLYQYDQELYLLIFSVVYSIHKNNTNGQLSKERTPFYWTNIDENGLSMEELKKILPKSVRYTNVE